MSLLAKDLHNSDIRIANPIEAENNNRSRQGLPLLEDCNESVRQISFGKTPQEQEESSDDSYSSDDKEETMPKTPARKKAPSSFASPGSRVAMGTNSPSGPARFVDGHLNPIAYPMMAGYWEKIDFNNNMKATGYVMCRMIVHPGITPTMVDAKWQSSTLLKIRFCWPEFFKSVLQMLAFDTVDIGNGQEVPKFGREHQLTGSFGKFVHERIEEDNQVWDEGFLSFDRPMEQDSSYLTVEVLDAKVGEKNYTLLQIVAQEAYPEEAKKEGKATIGARSVQTNSDAGKNYPNVRTRTDEDDNMDERSDDENDEAPNNRQRQKTSTGMLDGFTNKISLALQNVPFSGNQGNEIGPQEQQQFDDDSSSSFSI